MFFVYVIESQKNGSFYIGQTSNLESRIARHNKGRVFSTKNDRPWKIKYFIEVSSRSKSVILERKLKSIKKRDAIVKFCDQNNFRGVAQSG